MLVSSEGMKELKAHAERRERIKVLLAKYPEPWIVEKELHEYNDGAKEFIHVGYRHKPAFAKGEEVHVLIGDYLTPDLAELLVLLREHALATV